MKNLKALQLFDCPKLSGCLPASWKQQLAGFDVKANVFLGTAIHGYC
jgi:hypothetical protein